ncbi:MAG TPA: PEGA domain-containing protein [Myxococcaceae bacterium]|jgi:hypothetical protein
MSTRIKKEPQRKTARTTGILVGVILFVALGANGLAYVFLRRPATATPDGPATTTTGTAARPAAPAEEGDEGMARARRAAGIAALEHREYDKAVTELTEALRLRKDKGDLVELLNIANELRARDKVKAPIAPSPAPPTPPPAPVAAAPSRPPSKSKPTRVATREREREKPPPPEPEPAAAPEPVRNGLLLVTSTPPGLVVTVDGKAVDLTPARVPVRPGSHRVTLAQGERRVFDETVEVGEDVVKPVTWEAKPEPPPVVVAAAARTEPPPAPKPDPPPAPAPAVTKPPEAAVTARPSGSGDLEVTSPALYGEIWINDRPYGFPPVNARGLPAGKAKVEVRVQGAVKRKMTVEVVPGASTPVRVR